MDPAAVSLPPQFVWTRPPTRMDSSLTFLDPEDQELALGDTQGDDFAFQFTLPSQSQTATAGGGTGLGPADFDLGGFGAHAFSQSQSQVKSGE